MNVESNNKLVNMLNKPFVQVLLVFVFLAVLTYGMDLFHQRNGAVREVKELHTEIDSLEQVLKDAGLFKEEETDSTSTDADQPLE